MPQIVVLKRKRSLLDWFRALIFGIKEREAALLGSAAEIAVERDRLEGATDETLNTMRMWWSMVLRRIPSSDSAARERVMVLLKAVDDRIKPR